MKELHALNPKYTKVHVLLHTFLVWDVSNGPITRQHKVMHPESISVGLIFCRLFIYLGLQALCSCLFLVHLVVSMCLLMKVLICRCTSWMGARG